MADETDIENPLKAALRRWLDSMPPATVRTAIASFHLSMGCGSFMFGYLFLPRVEEINGFELTTELLTCAVLSIVSVLLLGVERQRSGPGLTSFGLFLLAVSLFTEALGEAYVLPFLVTVITKEVLMVGGLVALGSGLTLWYRSYQQAIEQLEALSSTDPLTGAANRRAFEQRLELELARARRDNSRFSIIAFDLDHFKKVNDRFGHAAGDMVLQEVVRVCQINLRETDLLARTGGEEFEILIAQANDADAAVLAERLRYRIGELDFHDVGRVSASFGVAGLRGAEDCTQLRERADKALYDAKNSGRNRVCRSS